MRARWGSDTWSAPTSRHNPLRPLRPWRGRRGGTGRSCFTGPINGLALWGHAAGSSCCGRKGASPLSAPRRRGKRSGLLTPWRSATWGRGRHPRYDGGWPSGWPRFWQTSAGKAPRACRSLGRGSAPSPWTLCPTRSRPRFSAGGDCSLLPLSQGPRYRSLTAARRCRGSASSHRSSAMMWWRRSSPGWEQRPETPSWRRWQ